MEEVVFDNISFPKFQKSIKLIPTVIGLIKNMLVKREVQKDTRDAVIQVEVADREIMH